MKIIVITPETFHAAEAGTINNLFRAGLEYLHIRKPAAKEETVRALIKCIDQSFYRRIIIHKYVSLQEEMKLGGIHIKLETFSTLVKSAFEGILSASAHRIEECRSLSKPNAHLFISPVFNSLSKEGYLANPTLLNKGNIARGGKLIALGGISAHNILEVEKNGFDGAAVLGYLWNSTNPVNQFLQLQKALSNSYGS